MGSNPSSNLDQWRILRFWLPLAGTWLMMAVEGALLAAIIARLEEPKENLAAYGVAFAFAIIVEAPVILLMSASTALATDRGSYLALRKFTLRLNLFVSGLMVLLIVPPVWSAIARMIGLGEEVAALTHAALILLLPWPAAIGERRFRQGLLIRSGRTDRVALGTVIRLCTMTTVAFSTALFSELPGAMVGALALSSGVVMEMLAIRRMAQGLERLTRRQLESLRRLSDPRPNR